MCIVEYAKGRRVYVSSGAGGYHLGSELSLAQAPTRHEVGIYKR